MSQLPHSIRAQHAHVQARGAPGPPRKQSTKHMRVHSALAPESARARLHVLLVGDVQVRPDCQPVLDGGDDGVLQPAGVG